MGDAARARRPECQSRKPAVIRWLASVITLVATCAIAWAAPTYPELTGRIVDDANLLTSADRTALETELAGIENTSTDQIAVVTVPSLQGYPIEDYGIGLARKWGIGQAGKDNGILLIVAPNERKVRIEVGRRLEPQMTDTMSKLIIENAILPKFRRGDYAGGISDGIRDIKSVILGDAEEVKRRAAGGRTPGNDPTVLIHLLVFFAIFAFIIYMNTRAMREMQREAGQTISPDDRRRMRRGQRTGPIIIIPGGSGDWGGGWSGGGGGGGWSGGGGSFGGGGASGDW